MTFRILLHSHLLANDKAATDTKAHANRLAHEGLEAEESQVVGAIQVTLDLRNARTTRDWLHDGNKEGGYEDKATGHALRGSIMCELGEGQCGMQLDVTQVLYQEDAIRHTQIAGSYVLEDKVELKASQHFYSFAETESQRSSEHANLGGGGVCQYAVCRESTGRVSLQTATGCTDVAPT